MENRLQIFNVMQRQIAYHTVPGVFRVFILGDAADAVNNAVAAVALFRFFNHLLAQIDPEYGRCPLLFGKFAVPPVAAPQIEHAFPVKRREQRF